jgi:aubergine-like protein
MCSKLGGDLYHLKFTPEINPLTMLIGIDVCHKSSQSIVGFVCSIDKKMAQYYS